MNIFLYPPNAILSLFMQYDKILGSEPNVYIFSILERLFFNLTMFVCLFEVIQNLSGPTMMDQICYKYFLYDRFDIAYGQNPSMNEKVVDR